MHGDVGERGLPDLRADGENADGGRKRGRNVSIEGIRGVYMAEDIRRESVFEKTLCREYVYDASRGCLVIAGAQ